jgi:hypothetical protein
MNGYEFLLGMFIVYCVYKVMAGGSFDKLEFKRGLIKLLRDGFNPPLDKIIESLEQGKPMHALEHARQLKDDLNKRHDFEV